VTTILIPTLDNGKAQKTAARAQERAGVLCCTFVIKDRERSGYTRTVNRGLELIGASDALDDDVCILVDDCDPCEGWLRMLQEAALEWASLPVWFAGPSGPCRTPPQNGGRPGDKRRPRVVPHLAGFCLYVAREALDKLGGLDEAYTHYASDVDIQRRAQRDYGAQSLWVPGAYVGHEVHPPHMEWWRKDQAMLNSRWAS
jgi:GT2 family glycosyltransferase